jgi:hypothetical protein
MPKTSLILLLVALLAAPAAAQFADTGQVNPEYARSDPALVLWADAVTAIERGPVDYQVPSGPLASYGNPSDMLGAAGTPVSLGDGGSLTVAFGEPITNGPGDDLVVFENGFSCGGGQVYAELAFVEVSTDGTTFARLPALCRNAEPTPSFSCVDASLYYNLAGNHAGGTGFDLQDLLLAGDAAVLSGAVDIYRINYVRIVDVIGDTVGPGTSDHFGRRVSDPYPTAFASGGFDATGVAGLHRHAVTTEVTSWSGVKVLFR